MIKALTRWFWDFMKKATCLIFFPVTLPIWLYRRSKKKKVSRYSADSIMQEPNFIAQHFAYNERIGQMYSVAKAKGDPHSKQMNKVIEACKKDIALAEQCRDYWRKTDKSLRSLPRYPSFSRLAIIYERRREYEEAIRVCRLALRMGYDDDGTEGGFPGRIARLTKKIGNDVEGEEGRR